MGPAPGAAPPPGSPVPQGPLAPGVSPSDVPTPIMQAMSFEALAEGSCRVVVTPGSAAPKSPEAEFEQVLDMAKMGLFGPMGDPTTTQIVLRLLNYQDPSTVVEAMQTALEARLKALAAQQPDPMALQQQKLAAIEQQQAALEAIKVHGESLLLEIKNKGAIALQELKSKHAAELEALKLHGQATLIDRQAVADAVPTAPKIQLNGELGPTALPSAEHHAGLEEDDEEELRQQNAADNQPQPAASGQTKKE